jgi:DNA end-binding protein Ku
MAPLAYGKAISNCRWSPVRFSYSPRLPIAKKSDFTRSTGIREIGSSTSRLTDEPVDDEDIVKGYDIGGGRYLEITEDEFEAIAVQGTHTIEIDQFVPKDEIDEIYWAIPYYIAPDGNVGRQAFSVIREAIKMEHMVALGRVVFTTREYVIAIEPRGKGTLGLTLRNPYVRDEELHFGNITDEKVPKDMLDLAAEIVRSNARHFQPDKFEDHYESALRELIGKKQRGEKIEKARKRPQAQVINLMDAQRQSAPPRGQRMPRDRSSTRARRAG